jgi:triacylglycerol lipase
LSARSELVAIVLLAVVSIAAVVYFTGELLVGWIRARRRPPEKPKRPPKLEHPIVLAHGFMGFDELKVGESRFEYFRGVPRRLRDLGAEVHVVRVSPIAGLERRGVELARAVRALDAKRVNIVAHSMGGLDARYAIAQLGLWENVVSLTTIGTPHRGTPLANMGAFFLEKLALAKILEWMRWDAGALFDLTTERMDDFNEKTRDHPDVAYGSYVATAGERLTDMHPLLIPAHLYLLKQAGANDGLVPAVSQTWGDVLGGVEADHWAQIGLSKRFDAPEFYGALLRELRGRGF